MAERTRAVFCDRDGVIIRDREYLSDPDGIEILPSVPAALRLLKDFSFRIIVVTNQSGVARGFFPESLVDELNQRISLQLSAQGAAVDRFYYCPHHVAGTILQYRVACDCRKPKPGMLLRAARELGIDLAHSFMVGDQPSDIAAGKSAGTRSIMINSGADPRSLSDKCQPDWFARNLLKAVEWILDQCKERPGSEP